jgi:predicted ATPase
MESRNVRQELQLAWDEDRPILPLMLEFVQFPDGMAFFLRGRQWIDLLDRPEAQWLPELTAAVQRMGLVLPAAAFPPVPAPPPVQIHLPSFSTQLVGREDELHELISRLIDNTDRLTTLTGPGGVGKTRLAVEAAQCVAAGFPGGVALIDLAPVMNAQMVASSIALTLGIREAADRPIQDILQSAFAARQRSLLLLDNFEQVIDAAPMIGELLARAPDLHILVTSRESLRIRGEREIALKPLDIPVNADLPTISSVAGNPAVALFVDAAAAVKPGFALTEENASVVAGICRRLDGLPLAIELAATRVRLFSPALLLDHLDKRLPLLTGGQRDRPVRQQTLENTIAWSYDLLSPGEQALVRLIGHFAGGASFDSLESVKRESGAAELDLMSGLTSLVDKSLVRQTDDPDGEPRFSMLETVREFALNAARGRFETDSIAQAHAHYFLDLILTTSHHFQVVISSFEALDRIHRDIENVRLAIKGCLDRCDAGRAAQFAIGLWGYFYSRGLYRESNGLCHAILQFVQDHPLSVGLHGGVLAVSAHMTTLLGDPGRGEAIGREALELLYQSDEEAPLVPLAPFSLVISLRAQGRFNEAMSVAEYGREICRRVGNETVDVLLTQVMGRLAHFQNDLDVAAEMLEQALSRSRGLGATALTLFTAETLSALRIHRGELKQAAALLLESERLLQQGGFEGVMMVRITQSTAVIAANASQYERGAQLLGYTASSAAAYGLILFDEPDVLEATARLRQQLGDAGFDAAYREGSMLSPAESVALIQEVLQHAQSTESA